MTGRTPARLLAPIALVTTALALFMIVAGGSGGEEGSGGEREAAPAQATPTATTTKSERRERRQRRTYTVKPGDTPSGIAEEVGIPLEELLDLNPDVDPQTLSPGQKLRVR